MFLTCGLHFSRFRPPIDAFVDAALTLHLSMLAASKTKPLRGSAIKSPRGSVISWGGRDGLRHYLSETPVRWRRLRALRPRTVSIEWGWSRESRRQALEGTWASGTGHGNPVL